MNNNLNQYKTQLDEERTVVINELKGISVNTGAKGEDDWEAKPNMEVDAADANEVSDRIGSYEGNTALVSNLEFRLREIDLAIQKMEKGTYGICEVCNEPIEEDRLAANPAARTCKTHLNDKLPEPQI